MKAKLTKENISSFIGDVVSLRLLDNGEPKNATWSVSGDAAIIRRFDTVPSAVLVDLVKEGDAVITADDGENKYTCAVSARPMRHAASDEDFNYYIGDMHVHTSNVHTADKFPSRTDGSPQKVIDDLTKEGKLDFTVISDHSCVLNEYEFLRGFIAAEESVHDGLVVLPGSESEITFLENDRYGIRHKNSGEIVSVNTLYHSNSRTYEEYYERIGSANAPISVLAHPQVMGSFIPGIWNFCLDRNQGLKPFVKCVEMGNGTPRSETPLFEHTLSVALDNGFRVSTSSGSDHHGPDWSATVCPGKTVIMAREKTKEAFIDALLSNRCYASEQGNIKIRYSVNSTFAPATIKATGCYEFDIYTSHIDGTKASELKTLEIITDGEERAARLENIDLSHITVKVENKNAHWFYLRFVAENGQKTWSTPVWTDLPQARHTAEDLKLIDKSEFTAYDEISEKSAQVLLNGNPAEKYVGKRVAEIVIDMKNEKSLRAVSVLAPMFEKREQLPPPSVLPEKLMHFPYRIEVLASSDGESYEKLARGYARVFGGENIFSFTETHARYIKIRVLSSVGQASGLPQYTDTPIDIGEIEFYS